MKHKTSKYPKATCIDLIDLEHKHPMMNDIMEIGIHAIFFSLALWKHYYDYEVISELFGLSYADDSYLD